MSQPLPPQVAANSHAACLSHPICFTFTWYLVFWSLGWYLVFGIQVIKLVFGVWYSGHWVGIWYLVAANSHTACLESNPISFTFTLTPTLQPTRGVGNVLCFMHHLHDVLCFPNSEKNSIVKNLSMKLDLFDILFTKNVANMHCVRNVFSFSKHQ